MSTTKTLIGGLEVTELTGEEAAEAISDFAGLELVPTEKSEWEQKLARAGFTATPSKRTALREEQSADFVR